MEKVQWNSIDKKQNGLKYSKTDKSSTLPAELTVRWTLRSLRLGLLRASVLSPETFPYCKAY